MTFAAAHSPPFASTASVATFTPGHAAIRAGYAADGAIPPCSADALCTAPAASASAQAAAVPAVRGEIGIDLPLRHAGPRHVRIRYEAVGSAGLPVLIVAGGISADRHVVSSERFPDAGWWQVQRGLGLDPARQRIVAIDWLGADGTLDAPIDSADQAEAIAAVLDALGIGRVAAFVGASYGAMVGLQFAVLYPQRLQRLVAISGAHRSHPYASAWRALQRRIVALGQLQCDEADGLSLARQLAMLSYRTPGEFAARFDAAPALEHGRLRVAAEDYLEHCGARYAARVPATAFLRLSESIDLHAVDPRDVQVPTTVVGIIEDRLVPIEDIHALIERLPQVEARLLRSQYGHDAFLKETLAIANALESAVQAGCEALETAGCGAAEVLA